MPALAIPAKSFPRDMCLFGIDWNNLNSCARQEQIEIAESVISTAAFDHDRGFYKPRGRDQTAAGSLNGLIEDPAFGLVGQYGNDCRCVNDHSRGKPRSS